MCRCAVELFVRHGVFWKRFGGCGVLQPDRVSKCFSPKVLGELGVMEDGADALRESAVEGFG